MQVVSAIASALALGAAAGLQKATSDAVQAGYGAIKNYIRQKFPAAAGSVEQLEAAPESAARRAVVEEDLLRHGAAQDADLVALARDLIRAVEALGPGAVNVTGVSLSKVSAGDLRVADVRSAGMGVRVDESQFRGDIDISGVSAGREDGTRPNE